jgi:hypothetical protein
MLNHFVIEYACYVMQYKVKLLKYQYLLLVTKIVLKLYSTGISLYKYTHTCTFASRHIRAIILGSHTQYITSQTMYNRENVLLASIRHL